MAAPAAVKLRIILGENNSQRLILQDGIPVSVSELAQFVGHLCIYIPICMYYILEFKICVPLLYFCVFTGVCRIQKNHNSPFAVQVFLPAGCSLCKPNEGIQQERWTYWEKAQEDHGNHD